MTYSEQQKAPTRIARDEAFKTGESFAEPPAREILAQLPRPSVKPSESVSMVVKGLAALRQQSLDAGWRPRLQGQRFRQPRWRPPSKRIQPVGVSESVSMVSGGNSGGNCSWEGQPTRNKPCPGCRQVWGRDNSCHLRSGFEPWLTVMDRGSRHDKQSLPGCESARKQVKPGGTNRAPKPLVLEQVNCQPLEAEESGQVSREFLYLNSTQARLLRGEK